MTSSLKKPATYILFILLVVGFGIFSGLSNPPGAWYQSLTKPWFNPPNWLFAPAWTILYVLIGIAGARTWLRDPASGAMWVWFLQLALNLFWSPLFFGQQNPLAGLMVIVPLFFAILTFIALTLRSDRPSALLFLPYAAWVAFATLLNASLYTLN
jgi:tryptophan-rich sensory protein